MNRAKAKLSIQKLFLYAMMFIAIMLIAAYATSLVLKDYEQFLHEAERLREDYTNSQKEMIRAEVLRVADFVNYLYETSEERLKDTIKDRTQEAHRIAQHLYEKYSGKISQRETETLILESLRAIRFNDGRGYYFVTRMDGEELLFADRPEMEHKNLLSMKNQEGVYVVKDMIDLVRKRGEGYFRYMWSKPNQEGINFPKIAYIKYFAPLNAFIGTGEYLDDVEKDLQREALERIRKIRFGDEGYIFVVSYDGVTLMNGVQPHLIGKMMWDMTDPYGVKVIQEERRVSEIPGGDFINYHWEKPSTGAITPKVSFVVGFEPWRWMMGTGVYLDEIESVIAQREKDAQFRSIINIIWLTLFLCLIFAGILLISWKVSFYIRKEIDLFTTFFKRLESSSEPIQEDLLTFEEFKTLGKSANCMLNQRLKTELALKNSEETFRALAENAKDVIMRFDRQGRHLYVNSIVEGQTGFPPEAFIGKTHAEMGFPEHLCRIWEEGIQRVLRTGQPDRIEFMLPNGSWVDWLLVPEPNEIGETQYVMTSARDITERKLAEESSKRSEAVLTAILQGSPIPMFFIDKNHTILHWNLALEKQTGIATEKVLGTNEQWKAFYEARRPCLADLLIDGHVDQIEAWYPNKVAKSSWIKEAFEGVDFFPMLGEGGKWLLFTAALVRDQHGNILGAMETLQDITQTKKFEETLRQSEERYRYVSDMTGQILYDWNIETGQIQWRGKTKEILGYSQEIMDSFGIKGWEDMVHPEDRQRVLDDLESTMEEKKLYFSQYRFRKADGNYAEMEDNGAFIYNRDGRPLRQLGVLKDVSKRKQAEEALRQSEESLRGFIENSLMGVNIIDEEGRIIEWNRANERLSGIPRARAIGEFIWDIMLLMTPWERRSEESRKVYHEAILKALETGIPLTSGLFEVEHMRLDGTKVIAEQITFPIKTGKGYRFGSLASDITSRKLAEKQLRESEERFRLLVKNSNDLLILLNAEGIQTYVSDQVEKMVGYKPEEVTGRSGFSFIHPDDAPHVMQVFSEAVNTPGAVRSVEYRSQCKKGGWRQLEGVGCNLLHDPLVNSIVLNVRDITERKQSEEALRASEERLRRVIEAAPSMLIIFDKEGDPVYISPNSEEITGYTPNQLIGEPSCWIHEESLPVLQNVWERALSEGYEEKNLEFKGKRKDESLWFGSMSWKVMRDRQGQIEGFVSQTLDISKRKKAEEENRRLEAQFLQAQKMESIGRLAGGVAHDFNNLLTGITGNVSLVMMDLDPNDPMYEIMEEVSKAADSAASLTRQLLAFSRKQIVEPKVIDVNEMIDHSQKMLARLIGEDIKLETVSNVDVGTVRIDPGQLEQILVNLSVNARDAMPDGGVLVIETSRVRLGEDYQTRHPHVVLGDYIMLAVSDTGVGMTDDVKTHLFEPFFTTKPKGRGTGLGLATIYGIMKQNNGNIEVYSELGQGTTFKLYFPLVEESPVKLSRREAVQAVPGGTETILLVEDEAVVRELAEKALKRWGYTVLAAPNGNEALKILETVEGTIHLLLTDVIMPGMNGRQLSEKVSLIYPQIKVLFTSGYTENTIAHHGVLDAGLAFIGKPYTPESLALKIREVLDREDPPVH